MNMKINSITKFSSIAILLALSACASETKSRVGTAATTPFSDLNIIRADIPEILAEAQHHPYLAPDGNNCEAIAIEIHKLDEVLGADLDAPASENRPSLLDRGADVAQDQAIGAVQRTAEGLIPFRGWVRKLSGAERYSKRVSASITAGSIRRAFLKGIAASQNCPSRQVVQATTVAAVQ
jgi:hypothetical protein